MNIGAIRNRIRQSHLDANDVMQEVFLNILRYPARFRPESAESFRNWGYRIVRNTTSKLIKKERPLGSLKNDFRDKRSPSPEESIVRAESDSTATLAYLLYLNVYLVHFGRLSTTERSALTLVDVERASYKETAKALGISMEKLKMVIFRARKKVRRRISQSLDELGRPSDS